MIKNFLRWLLLVPNWLGLHDGYFYAKEGSLWCKFLFWLYGDDPDAVVPDCEGL